MYCTASDYTKLLHRVTEEAVGKFRGNAVADVHPVPRLLAHGQKSLIKRLPEEGLSVDDTIDHLIEDVGPALSNSTSPRYFGFVTGGSTPAAQLADFLTSTYDQNVQVHLPQCSISTSVEAAALGLVLDLLRVDGTVFTGRTLTTGATTSNLLGLACGRNAVLGKLGIDVGEEGVAGARVKVYCVSAHASVRKAASLIGIGRRNCVEVADEADEFRVTFDLPRLESLLAGDKSTGTGSIVVASMGEVNTGLCTPHLDKIREICDKYGAWLHVDAAFAVFAGVYEPLCSLLQSLSHADSICVDAHKWLNVPYDCAMFFTRDLTSLKQICASGPAAYLTMATQASPKDASMAIESPLNVGIENSRRFRALPLYSSLVAYGRTGYAAMIKRNLDFARALDQFLRNTTFYEVLTPEPAQVIGDHQRAGRHETTNIVLFTVRRTSTETSQEQENRRVQDVVEALNGTRELYVTATTFRGRACARFAISNWRTGLCRRAVDGMQVESTEDLDQVTRALERVSLQQVCAPSRRPQ